MGLWWILFTTTGGLEGNQIVLPGSVQISSSGAGDTIEGGATFSAVAAKISASGVVYLSSWRSFSTGNRGRPGILENCSYPNEVWR